MPFTLITTPFDASTPGLIDPGTYGAPMASVPAGSYVEATILLSLGADQPSSMSFTLSPNASADGPVLGDFDATRTPPDPAAALGQPPAYTSAGIPRPNSTTYAGRALAPCVLSLAVFSVTLPVTAISGEAVVKIYS
jgi:hypothetical protein